MKQTRKRHVVTGNRRIHPSKLRPCLGHHMYCGTPKSSCIFQRYKQKLTSAQNVRVRWVASLSSICE